MPDLKTTQRYREILAPYRPNSGHLLAALHAVQHEFGYVPVDAVPEVARQLGMTAAQVYGALSFYSEFRTEPPARIQVNWCSGPACRLKGGDNIRLVLETVLGLRMEEQSEDGEIGLHLAQCDGSCDQSPLVWVNGKVVGGLTAADAVRLARELKTGKAEV